MDLEEKRLQALKQYEVLSDQQKKSLNNLAKLASRICGTPAAQINFIDDRHQRSVANIGWGKREIPVGQSFCARNIKSKGRLMLVSNASQDPRFQDNPLVKADPPLLFYAGYTIRGADQQPIGTLCVFDSEPRELTSHQQEALQILAEEVETHLKLHRNRNELKETLVHENELNHKIISSLPVNFFMYNEEGQIVRWNEYMKSITGYTDEEIRRKNPTDYFDQSEIDKVQKKMEEVFKGEEVVFKANFIKKDGTSAPFLFSASRFDMEGEKYLIGTGQEITELIETQHRLEESLEEKKVLLAEIHHRVKNNLAVIMGLIELESLDSEETETEKKLNNTKLRIRSMALVHEIMYQTKNFTHVKFDNVIGTIAEYVKKTYPSGDHRSVVCKTDPVTLNVNQAIPFGLIINELLTNAWKHAYPENEEGKILVEMSKEKELVTFRIADRGVGFPDYESDINDFTGITIVNQLCKQLNADIKLNRDKGTEFIITFTKKDIKGSGSAL